MANIGSLYAYIGADTTGLSLAQKQVSSFVTGTTARFKSLTGIIAGLTTTFVGMAAVGGFTKIIKSGIEYERVMTTVKGVTKATAAEFEAMKKVTKEIGASTEWTAKQAGEGLEFVTKAGFDVATSIKALPHLIDLATAGEIELAKAADIATNAMASMGIGVNQLEGMSDDFVTTINATKAGMEDLSESFRYAAPGASAFGYTLEQLLALLGQLAQSGVDGSMAGTQLSNAFIESAKYAQEAGLASSNFIDVLKHLNKEQATEVEIMDIFGDRAGRAALLLRNKIDAYEDLHKQLKNNNGETKELANIMRDNLGTSLTLLISALDGLSKKLYEEVFRDDLKDNIEGLTYSIVEFTDSIVFLAKVIKIPFAALGRLWDLVQTVVYGLNSVASMLVALFFDVTASVYRLLEALSKVPTLSKIFGFDTGDDSKIIAFLQKMQSQFSEISFTSGEKTGDNLYSAFFGEDLLKQRGKMNKEVEQSIKELEAMKAKFLESSKNANNAEANTLINNEVNKNNVVKKTTTNSLQAYQKMYEDMGYYGKEWYDNEVKLLTQQAEEYKEITGDKLASEEWLQDQIAKLRSNKEINSRIDILLESEFESVDELENNLKQRNQTTKQYNQDRLMAYKSMYDDMKEYSTRYYEYEKELVKLQAEEYKNAGVDPTQVKVWEDYQNREIEKKELVDTGGFMGGMVSGMMEVEDSMKNSFARIGQFGKDSFTSIYQSFEDTIYNGLQGKFDSISDIWENTWDEMKNNALRIFSKMLMEMAMQKLITPALEGLGSMGGGSWGGMASGVASFFGGMTGAANGGVFSGPTSGYPMMMHGNEAVIPLKDGKVPVEMSGQDKSTIVNMYISTPDVTSFKRSRAQITGDIKRALS